MRFKTKLRVRVSAVLTAGAAGGLCLALGPAQLSTATAPKASSDVGEWRLTAPMLRPRAGAQAVLLNGTECLRSAPPEHCGKVLVVGGTNHRGGVVNDSNGQWPRPPDDPARPAGNSAELFDPVSSNWSETGSFTETHHTDHELVLLDGPNCGDNCGEVLLVGGSVDRGDGGGWRAGNAVAELYDPVSGKWATTKNAPDSPHMWSVAQPLSSKNCGSRCGGVLVVQSDQAEVFHPATEAWEKLAPPPGMPQAGFKSIVIGGRNCAPRCGHVLLAAGQSANTAVLDPVSLKWSPGSLPLADQDRGPTSLEQLPSGKILARAESGKAWLFDPERGSWKLMVDPPAEKEPPHLVSPFKALAAEEPPPGTVAVKFPVNEGEDQFQPDDSFDRLEMNENGRAIVPLRCEAGGPTFLAAGGRVHTLEPVMEVLIQYPGQEPIRLEDAEGPVFGPDGKHVSPRVVSKRQKTDPLGRPVVALAHDKATAESELYFPAHSKDAEGGSANCQPRPVADGSSSDGTKPSIAVSPLKSSSRVAGPIALLSLMLLGAWFLARRKSTPGTTAEASGDAAERGRDLTDN